MKITNMLAAFLVEQNQPLVVDEVSLPKLLDFGQVLVRLHYSGICGSQLGEIKGVKGKDPYLPHLMGHEGTGTVLEIGSGVTRVAVDDHVVLHWKPASGIEANPPKYEWSGQRLNAGKVTTFNECSIVSENRLTKIPNNFDMKLATLFGCAVTTAFGVVNNDANIKIGQSVVVIGLGGLGMNIVQAASMVSANPIVGIDLYKEKFKIAKKFGLTHSFYSESKNRNQKIKQVVGASGADVVIETTGNSRLIEQAYELTNDQGKTILVGVPNKGDNISIYSLPLHFKKVLKGSHGGDAIPDIDIPRYIRLIEARKMSLNELITHEFGLKDINDALDLFKTGKAGRIVINLGKNNC